MTLLDPRPWDEIPEDEQDELVAILAAVRDWNRHQPVIDITTVKTRRKS